MPHYCGMKIGNLFVRHYLSGLIIFSFFFTSCVSTKVSKEDKVDIVIAKARSFTGTPYKYGGTTSLGMDCSGLLMRSFEAIDMYIPRTSKEQSKLGQNVQLNEIQKGDLVFFAAKKGSKKITHAGLVTSTKGKDRIIFIHSSSSKGVIEVNLLNDYYRKIFVKARRIKF